jgi:hypothetical protein
MNEIELPIDSTDSNQSGYSLTQNTKIILDGNRTLVIELLPMDDSNSSLPQQGLYRAKIINSKE